MRVPIPDDWNGQDWSCYQIEFPDSPQWTAIFLGLITYATRGRYWDERTGQVRDAQAIGQEIYARNFPFVDCAGEPIPDKPIDKDTVAACAAMIEIGVQAMSLCGYNPKAFDIIDGVLYVKDFCGEWVAIGELSSQPEPESDIITPPPDGADDATPCSKAYKAAVFLHNVATVAMAEADTSTDVWDFYSDTADQFANIDFAYNDMARAWVQGVSLDLQGKQGEATDAIIIDYLACYWSDLISTGQQGVIQSEYGTMRDAIRPALTRYFVEQHGGNYASWGETLILFWWWLFQAVGAADWAKVTFGAQPTPGQDCACPEVLPTYSGLVWWKDARIIDLQTNGATVNGNSLQAANSLYFRIEGIGDAYQEVVWREQLSASGTISELVLEVPYYSAPDIAGHYPADAWDLAAPTPTGNYWKPAFTGAGAPVVTYSPTTGKQTVKWVWPTPINLNDLYLQFACKVNPKAKLGLTQNFRMLANLVYAGPERT